MLIFLMSTLPFALHGGYLLLVAEKCGNESRGRWTIDKTRRFEGIINNILNRNLVKNFGRIIYGLSLSGCSIRRSLGLEPWGVGPGPAAAPGFSPGLAGAGSFSGTAWPGCSSEAADPSYSSGGRNHSFIVSSYRFIKYVPPLLPGACEARQLLWDSGNGLLLT